MNLGQKFSLIIKTCGTGKKKHYLRLQSRTSTIDHGILLYLPNHIDHFPSCSLIQESFVT